MNIYHWFGRDAASVWQDYQTELRKRIEQAERDAEAMRHLAEAVDA